jgi:hemoglobin-like flavoprotein
VANEVKQLAAQTAQATTEIAHTLEQLTQHTERLAALSEKAEHSTQPRPLSPPAETVSSWAEPPAPTSGPITQRQIELVQSTFAKVEPIADVAAKLFYDRLFTLDPKLRPLFKGDIKEQGRKLMSLLKVAVHGLRNIEKLAPAVEALGQRHATYGVKDADYATVASALLWTLKEGLGEAFTAEVQDAWTAVYTVLAGVMMKAAANSPVQESVPSAPAPTSGPITQRQIELVQSTFAKVEPIADVAAKLFYDRLFTLDPKLRPLFKGDIKEQGRKLMSLLKVAVHGLRNIEKLAPAVEALGQRHATYGVKDADYATVASALLWTLKEGLGEAFTAEVQDAWAAVYTVLAGVMMKAAESQMLRKG